MSVRCPQTNLQIHIIKKKSLEDGRISSVEYVYQYPKSNIDYIEDAESIELQETTPENKVEKTKETRENSPVLNKIFKKQRW